jgi:hypothetical protein
MIRTLRSKGGIPRVGKRGIEVLNETSKPRSRIRSQCLRNESRHNNQTQGQNSGY